MTEVTFHYNVADPVAYACGLIRDAFQQGTPAGVIGPEAVLRQLDERLWTFSQLDFVPHCSAGAAPAMLAHSPIVLGHDCAAFAHGELLVHLGADVPAGFERFRQLAEIVGTDAATRTSARGRWRYYEERGYTIRPRDGGRARS